MKNKLSKVKNLTADSLKLFLAYAKDARNWGGMPLVGGNVGGSKQDAGNLTDLKKAKLVTTCTDEGCQWIIFTALGREFALEQGVEIVGL